MPIDSTPQKKFALVLVRIDGERRVMGTLFESESHAKRAARIDLAALPGAQVELVAIDVPTVGIPFNLQRSKHRTIEARLASKVQINKQSEGITE